MNTNHTENTFWKSNVKMVPGRPSPTRDFNRSTSATNKTKNISSNSFENYQRSVSDAWTLSEDELTKEYCILSDEPKNAPRKSIPKAHKTPIAVVHNSRQAASTSSANNVTISATNSTTANSHPLETVEEDEIVKIDVKQKQEQTKEYG